MTNRSETCPWCGADMEAGTWRSRGCNYFQPDDQKPAHFFMKSQIEKHGGIMLTPSPYDLTLEIDWPKGFVCRKCKKIVVPYEE